MAWSAGVPALVAVLERAEVCFFSLGAKSADVVFVLDALELLLVAAGFTLGSSVSTVVLVRLVGSLLPKSLTRSMTFGSQFVSSRSIAQATTAILRARAIAAFFLRVFCLPEIRS